MARKTKEQKFRQRVAKDVLKHLATEQLIAESGEYFFPHESTPSLPGTPRSKLTYGDVVVKSQAKCYVCAIGAAFYSTIMLNAEEIRQCPYFGASMTTLARSKLPTYFPTQQLADMELAFEGDYCMWKPREGETEVQPASTHTKYRVNAFRKTVSEEEEWDTRNIDSSILKAIFSHIATHGDFTLGIFLTERGF